MNMENATQLSRIYNTLLMVKTSGEDTVLMGECLKALKTFIAQIEIEIPEENN